MLGVAMEMSLVARVAVVKKMSRKSRVCVDVEWQKAVMVVGVPAEQLADLALPRHVGILRIHVPESIVAVVEKANGLLPQQWPDWRENVCETLLVCSERVCNGVARNLR